MFKSNGTTSVPKSIPRFVVDKVKLLYSSQMFLIQSILFFFLFYQANTLPPSHHGWTQSILFDIKVPNKSLSQELNNVSNALRLVT